ncbi:mei2-like protein [Fusarium pseudoanthophilum]|uniref:Mei2-like protein n=1 Tax=Fusarium pseudoanthophilum TaxID=48495 RepID=A0A8H5L0T0_9HYPO|nr:mei2-like protein [Fusarium pseudoanthophilum]
MASGPGSCAAYTYRQVPGQPLEVTARPSCGLRHQERVQLSLGAGERHMRWARPPVKQSGERTASCRSWALHPDCRDEQRRRHSQYGGGTRLAELEEISYGQASEDPFVEGGLAQGSTLSATSSSFQPIDQRSKGKNALVFYPEGSPTVAGALSQDMDTYPPRQHLHQLYSVHIFPNTLGDFSPTHWGRLAKNVECRVLVDVVGFNKYHLAQGKRENKDPEIEVHHRGSRGLNNIVDLGELIAGRDSRTTIMLRNIPNKDGQPPSAQVAGVSLSGGPVACFDSGWPELFGDLVARRSVYGADMLPRTTEFGVSVEEARHLKKKQKADDTAKATAAQDGGGIWDGTQTQNNNLI